MWTLLGALAGCDSATSGGNEATDGGIPGKGAAGEPCYIVQTSFKCSADASVCYGAGNASSCAGNALCVGDGKGLTCARACAVDSDCTADGSNTVCLQGCKTAILNGYCVLPATRTKLLDVHCANGSSSTASVAGWSL